MEASTGRVPGLVGEEGRPLVSPCLEALPVNTSDMRVGRHFLCTGAHEAGTEAWIAVRCCCVAA